MKKAFITRRMTFAAAHRLHSAELSDAENRRMFGKCNHPGGHGHNYVVEVTLYGPVDPVTGMVFNLTDLKKILNETVETEFDHRHLNEDVPAFRKLTPTAENIAVVIWEMLEKRLPKGLLHEIRLVETENNSVVYRGEDPARKA